MNVFMPCEKMPPQINCACGAVHKSRIAVKGELSAVLPRGVKIFVLGEAGSRLRRDYRCDSYIPLAPIASELDKIRLDEDVRAVVQCGPYGASAAYIAARNRLPAYNISSYCSGGTVIKNGLPILYPSFRRVITSDVGAEGVAELFAYVASSLLSLFDWEICALLEGAPFCPDVFKSAFKSAETLVCEAAVKNKRSDGFFRSALEAASKAEAFAGYCPSAGRSGAVSVAAAFKALCVREERETLSDSENTLLFALKIAKLYEVFLSDDAPFVFPPDYYGAAAAVKEYFGADETAYYDRIPPFMSQEEEKLRDHRLRSYRRLLLGQITSIRRKLEFCVSALCRIYPDDGFYVRGYLPDADARLCAWLGADVLPLPSLLSYIRRKGALDFLAA